MFCDFVFSWLGNHCDYWKHHCGKSGIKEAMYTQKSASWTSGNQTATSAVCWFPHGPKQFRATVCPASSNDDKCCHLLGWPARWIIFIFLHLFFCTSLITFSLAQAVQRIQLYKNPFTLFTAQILLVSSSLCSFWRSSVFNRIIIRSIKRHKSLSRGLNLWFLFSF